METISIERSAEEKIIIQEKIYKGKTYIDVHIWFKPGKVGGEYVPTQKGINMTREKFEEFRAAIAQIGQEVRS